MSENARAKKSRPKRHATTKQALLSLGQASSEYGPPATTLRDRCLSGEIAYIKIGRRIWIERAELDRFISAHRVRLADAAFAHMRRVVSGAAQ